MAMSSNDRLCQLFLSTMDPSGSGNFDDAAIDRAVAQVEQMLGSQEAVQHMGSATAVEGTLVLIGMGLEEKPGAQLARAAIRCYERVVERIGDAPKDAAAGWGRCVVLQQLGKVLVQTRRLEEAKRWATECAQSAEKLKGHPRDVSLFGGSFGTNQTAREFRSAVYKLLAKICHEQGDHIGARSYLVASGVDPQKLGGGDGAARGGAQGAATAAGAGESEAAAAASSGGLGSSGYPGAAAGAVAAASKESTPDGPAALWRAKPAETLRLKEYSFVDDGDKGTVTLILNLKQHVQPEAVELVQSTQQCKVQCTKESCTVRIRWWAEKEGEAGKKVLERVLVLDPLNREIIPEDTVTKLKGAETKRRLEVLLFKRDKDSKWFGDIVDSTKKKTLPQTPADAEGAKKAVDGPTLLEPLTQEQLDQLPKPGGTKRGENRPGAAAAPVAAAPGGGGTNRPPSAAPAPAKTAIAAPTVPAPASLSDSAPPRRAPEQTPEIRAPPRSERPPETKKAGGADNNKATMPVWVEEVSVRDEGAIATLVEVVLATTEENAALAACGFGDLELSIAPETIRLSLAPKFQQAAEGFEEELVVPLKNWADVDKAEAKWKKKLKKLELRLPRV